MDATSNCRQTYRYVGAIKSPINEANSSKMLMQRKTCVNNSTGARKCPGIAAIAVLTRPRGTLHVRQAFAVHTLRVYRMI